MKPAKNPELTDQEIVEIRLALREEPEWMQISFEISLNTGCRLRETQIPLNCVDFRENKITFPHPKGGEDRAFSIPMPTAIRPLLERVANEGRRYTLEFLFQPASEMQQFFIKVKKPHLCFHCLRVAYVNRLRRAGVPRGQDTKPRLRPGVRARSAALGFGWDRSLKCASRENRATAAKSEAPFCGRTDGA